MFPENEFISLDEANESIKSFGDIKVIEAYIVDINGIPRGKWLPAEHSEKLFKQGLNLPLSAFALDIWGQDVIAAGLVNETGDNDGVCKPVKGSLKKTAWSNEKSAQVLMTMFTKEGHPFQVDPRQVLSHVVSSLNAKNLFPVCSVELEFYVINKKAMLTEELSCDSFSTMSLGSKLDPQLYSLSEMDVYKEIYLNVLKLCEDFDFSIDALHSEFGPGQFEISLKHLNDPLKIADQLVYLKRILKAAFDQFDYHVTFMAKPYLEKSGSGLHVHLSMLNEENENVFCMRDNLAPPSDILLYSIGGLVKTMKQAMLVFAPHFNSYRRFQKGSHAPVRACWGIDNRMSAIRVIPGGATSSRLEHRVSGADANPYLVLASILAGVSYGIDEQERPGQAMEGDRYLSKSELLPNDWKRALSAFSSSDFIKEYLNEDFHRVYKACKMQEVDLFSNKISNVEYNSYL